MDKSQKLNNEKKSTWIKIHWYYVRIFYIYIGMEWNSQNGDYDYFGKEEKKIWPENLVNPDIAFKSLIFHL